MVCLSHFLFLSPYFPGDVLIETGWWLAKLNSKQGWAPSAYLKEELPPAPAPPPPPPAPAARAMLPPPPAAAKTNGKPKPPAPPAKRPVRAGGAAAVAPGLQARDSAVSVNQNSDSGRSTPSLAGGLAEALRARQNKMQGKREEEDDDDW